MDRRGILEQLAAGELTPEEAAARLDALDAGRDGQPSNQAEEAIRRVRIEADFRSCSISGDPAVSGAVADGPHVARREGDVLVIDARAPIAGDDEGFVFERGDRPRVIIGLGSRPRSLAVRMNPDLPLEIEVSAGGLSVTGVHAPIRAKVDAGSVRLHEVRSPFDLDVDAGSVHVSGTLTSGDSRIRCDAGSVRVALRAGSSVRVKAHADVGKVVVGERRGRGVRIGGQEHEAVFGAGAGVLLIQGGIGKIVVEES